MFLSYICLDIAQISESLLSLSIRKCIYLFLLYLLRTAKLAVDNVIKVPCTVISSDKRVKLVCTVRRREIAPITVSRSIRLCHYIVIISLNTRVLSCSVCFLIAFVCPRAHTEGKPL